MKLFQTTERSRILNEKQWSEWNQTIFRLFHKVWLITFIIELFLFFFFQPTPEVSRSTYFAHYIILPSGLEALVLFVIEFILVRLLPSRARRTLSLYTILLVTSFTGITVCIHTSVSLLPAMLVIPMTLTPLYRDKLMTYLQIVLVVLLYIANSFYFTPNTPYNLPVSPLSPFLDTCIFFGCTLVTYIMLDRVNEAVVLNEENSRRDSLTHLYNHENFYAELACYLNEYEEKGKAFSIIVADIDNFKKVNDTYGHAFGDEVIKQLSELFGANEPKGAFSARYGGEEFAMIIPDTDPLPIAEKIRSDFESFDFETSEGIKHFTVSIGAAVYDRKYTNASSFFEKADTALYKAKHNGKNQVVI